MSVNQKESGLYKKFTVYRNDGRDKNGGDRENAEYFVLDLAHDPHALAAIEAYVNSCYKDYPVLASDLFERYLDTR